MSERPLRLCERDLCGGIEEDVKLEMPAKFDQKEFNKKQAWWRNEIIKSYDNEFRRIEREHEETLKCLWDIEYKPKKSIVKFSSLHKGMYKGY